MGLCGKWVGHSKVMWPIHLKWLKKGGGPCSRDVSYVQVQRVGQHGLTLVAYKGTSHSSNIRTWTPTRLWLIQSFQITWAIWCELKGDSSVKAFMLDEGEAHSHAKHSLFPTLMVVIDLWQCIRHVVRLVVNTSNSAYNFGHWIDSKMISLTFYFKVWLFKFLIRQ